MHLCPKIQLIGQQSIGQDSSGQHLSELLCCLSNTKLYLRQCSILQCLYINLCEKAKPAVLLNASGCLLSTPKSKVQKHSMVHNNHFDMGVVRITKQMSTWTYH